jgi:molybdopterin molybdotransferase
MISEEEALAAILNAVAPADTESVPLPAAAGRFVSRDVRALLPLPSFDNSSMDGWAIHDADCGKSGVTLAIVGEQPAGADGRLTVREGEAVRIFTGAPLPAGTAAIVMQEDADCSGDRVVIREPAREGEFIRRTGSDICAGQLLVRRGEPLNAQRIGALAAQGMAGVECGRQPRAVIVCTGEELTAPGLPLPHHGCLYNSNGPMLAALLDSSRAARPAATDTVPDDLEALTNTLRRRHDECDALIIAGGVSVGDYDLVRPALQQLGITPAFWRVSVKPGKPFLFGASGRKLVFGLPGNPVSAFVTAVLFVLPALRRMAGAAEPSPVLTTARSLTELRNEGNRTHYVRGQFDAAAGTFHPVGVQESHAIAGLASANALAKLDPGAQVSAGEPVRVLRLDD